MPYKDPEKAKENKRRYYQRNKKTLDAANAQWVKDHPEEFRDIQKRYEATEKGEIAVKKKEKKFSKTEKAVVRRKKYVQKNRKKINEKARIYRSENREKIRKLSRKYNNTDKGRANSHRLGILRKYGITIDQYNGMLEQQNGVCAICENPETSVFDGVVKRLSVDHDHETGEVRGLLCHNCNRKIAVLEDALFCERATVYLTTYITPE